MSVISFLDRSATLVELSALAAISFVALRLKGRISGTVVFGIAIACRALIVLQALAGLREQLSSGFLGAYLLRPSVGYIRAHASVFVRSELLALGLVVALGLFLRWFQRTRPESMVPAEPAMIAAALLVLGWPGMVLGFFVALAGAVVTSLVQAVRHGSFDHRVRLGVAVIIGSAITAVLLTLPAFQDILATLRV